MSHISFTSRKPINSPVFSWWLVCLNFRGICVCSKQMSTGWDNKKEGGTGDILTQSFYPQQCCEEFLLNLRSRSSCCWDIKSSFSSFLVCLMLFVLGLDIKPTDTDYNAYMSAFKIGKSFQLIFLKCMALLALAGSESGKPVVMLWWAMMLN